MVINQALHFCLNEATMQKELTIAIDERAYAYLHRVVGPDNISKFIESLLQPHLLKDTEELGSSRRFAEEKAIQRIHEGVDEADWILVSDPNQEIDADELDAQLRACGYID
jgi:hypothetical protein